MVEEGPQLRVVEALVDVANLGDLAVLERPRKRNLCFASPFGTCAPLLKLRDAFGHPAWHPVVGHLQADDMRHLVPEGGGPAEGARRSARGESSVTTFPKHAPSAPTNPGRPIVRTAKSSCFGNISTRIGPVGLNWYFSDSVSKASRASGTTWSRMTPASSGCSRTMRSPSRNVWNLSTVSSIASWLKVTTSYGSALNAVSNARRAPGSSPTRNR